MNSELTTYFKNLNLEINDTSQYSSESIKATILIKSFRVNSTQNNIF